MKQGRLQVGLDISQQGLDMCAMTADGELEVPHQRFANSREGAAALRATLAGLQAAGGYTGVDLGGEATGTYWLPLFLEVATDAAWQGMDVVPYLLNARQVHWFKKSHAPDEKTDARDSFYVTEKLRTQSRRQHAWEADVAWRSVRLLSRQRFHIGQSLSREKNIFWAHMYLFCNAYRRRTPFGDGVGVTARRLLATYPDWQALAAVPDEPLLTQLTTWSRNTLPDPATTLRRLRQTVASSYVLPAPLRAAVHAVLTHTVDRIGFLEKQAAALERQLRQQVADHHPQVQHLVAIKGLGIVLGAGIAAEIGDLSRFFQGEKWDKRRQRYRRKNLRDVEDAVAKSAGLWWPRHDSGHFHAQERRLSKKGNRYLRYYLVEAADKLRQHQPHYHAYYQRKYRETSKFQHKRALVLTARKSVGLFVGLLHRNEPYRPPEV